MFFRRPLRASKFPQKDSMSKLSKVREEGSEGAKGVAPSWSDQKIFLVMFGLSQGLVQVRVLVQYSKSLR